MTWFKRGFITVFRKFFPFFEPIDGPYPVEKVGKVSAERR